MNGALADPFPCSRFLNTIFSFLFRDERTQRQDVSRRLVEPGAPKTAYLSVRGGQGIPARNHLESFQCVYVRIQIASHPSIQGYGQSWANSWKPGSHACSSLRSRGGRPPLPGKSFIAISRCKEQACAWGWKPVGKRAGLNDCPPSRGTRHSSGAAAHKRA